MKYSKYPLSQFFTPRWAAEMLYNAHFSHLGPSDLLLEPTCGNGSLLASVPLNVPCVGIEIDPALVAKARKLTNRPVIQGDCLTADISEYGKVTAVFGNPPFVMELFEKLLERCANLLGIGQKAGFIIPAYFFQTSQTVCRLGRKWSIEQEMLPRDIFPSLIKPLMFGTFIRDNSPQLIGFRLYPETAALKEFSDETKRELMYGMGETRGVWKTAISNALNKLGGSASLEKIYDSMRNNRPTKNEFWKEQIRKVLQKHFTKIETGIYMMPN